jgi:hypothetical protein
LSQVNKRRTTRSDWMVDPVALGASGKLRAARRDAA